MKPFSTNWYIIANPAAGGGKVQRQLNKIKNLLEQQGFAYLLVQSEAKGHATQLAQQAIEQGYRKIMAIGGDGTNNEVINGILQQQIVPSLDITYALLPVGTGNDWIKTHGIPRDLQKALSIIKKEQTKIQDIGRVDFKQNGQAQHRFFANVAGMAYDAYVVKQAAKHPKYPYLLMVMKCLFEYELPKARIYFGDEIIEDQVYIVNAGICRYSGGGMQLVPHAVPDDGQLALTIARTLTPLQVIINTRHLYSGKLDRLKAITLHQSKHIRVEAVEEAIGVEVDGEYLGETPVAFSVLEKRLKVVC